MKYKEYIKDLTIEQVNKGKKREEILQMIYNLPQLMSANNKTDIEQYVSKIIKDIEKIKKRAVRKSVVTKEIREKNWYEGPDENDVIWNGYKNHLLTEKKWSKEIINSIDEISTQIIALTPSFQTKNFKNFKIKGLVLGYVQSGKTANYSAVIAKLADRGYFVIIVLTGLTKTLRKQTQIRLIDDLVDNSNNRIFPMTDYDKDFDEPTFSIEHLLSIDDQSDSEKKRILIVTKKNKSRLNKLINWLKEGKEFLINKKIPLLIIDDEADQASPNSSKSKDESRRTAINKCIVELTSIIPNLYIAYTATPFANVLINPHDEKDLYPKDFIFSIPKSPEYIGPEEIFGKNVSINGEYDTESDTKYDIINEIKDEELEFLVPPRNFSKNITNFQPNITQSLREAIIYFITVCSEVRYYQKHGDRYKDFENLTMLIHTTHLTDPHFDFENLLQDLLEREFRKILNSHNSNSLLKEFKEIWIKQRKKNNIDKNFDESIFDTKEYKICLMDFFKEKKIIIMNSTAANSEDNNLRKAYENENIKYLILIGGNILSRGLTLERLIVSFFARSARAYDTLLQMGRWFGYTKNIIHIERIWMTNNLKENFGYLAFVEQSLRNSIERYELEGLTPKDFAVRIPLHPVMKITGKMGSARLVYSSFSGTKQQTYYYQIYERGWLKKNIQATENLIRTLKASPNVKYKRFNQHHVYLNVEIDIIINFFNSYSIDENSFEFSNNAVLDYLKENKEKEPKWDVVILSLNAPKNTSKKIAHIELAGLDINLLNRNRLKDLKDNKVAIIKALIGIDDMLIDLNAQNEKKYSSKEILQKKEYSDNTLTRENRVIMFRKNQIGDKGLLLIYPINKDSKPDKGKMVPLNAKEHVIGIGAYFPMIEKEELSRKIKYVSANLKY